LAVFPPSRVVAAAAAVPQRNGVAARALMSSTAASDAMHEKRVAGEYTAANVQVVILMRGSVANKGCK
jgi:DNA gyrase subunit B